MRSQLYNTFVNKFVQYGTLFWKECLLLFSIPVPYEIFSTTTLDYWENYHDSFRVTHAQYELRGLLWFRFSGADSIENDDDIGLSEHLS